MENLIEIAHLCKQYGAFSLKDVNLTLPAGSIVGLIGENGAGKTTTLKSLLGLIRPDEGQINLMGLDAQKEGVRAHREIGVVLDECCFHEHLTPAHLERILSPLFPSWDPAYYAALLRRFALDPTKCVKALSRGMKTKLSLACAMAHHPRLLILDEATSGLDPVVRSEMLDLFLEFIQDDSRGILMSTHITTDLERVADYIVLLQHGQIRLAGEKDQMLERFAVAQLHQGEEASIRSADRGPLRRHGFGAEMLVADRRAFSRAYPHIPLNRATLDDIMVFYGKGEM